MKRYVIDYETTGLYPYRGDKVFAAVITDVATGESEVLKREQSRFLPRLRYVWEHKAIEKVCHNLKFELGFTIFDFGITPAGILHDTMILHQLYDNLSPSHALDRVAMELCGYVKEWDEADKAIDQARKIYGTYDKIPWDLMEKYIRYDGQRTGIVFNTLYPLFEKSFTYHWEIETVITTQRMEQRGIMLAVPEAKKLISFMQKELEQVEKTSYNLLGYNVNLNSTKQLSKLLFEDRKLPVLKRTEKGAIDTTKETLEELRKQCNDPVLDLVLKQRSYTKGVSMIQSYLDVAQDGILHPNINTNSARTGRETSSDPNTQNISKEVALKNRYPVPARKCFRARPGYVLLLGDYAGIEMRLGVQGTKSERLYKLARENFDFHTACAKSFYGKKFTDEKECIAFTGIADYEKAKKALRSSAKNARFAMFYGAGLEKVAKTLNLSVTETQVGYERDKVEYPEFYTFMRRCISSASKQGYIETFFGTKKKIIKAEAYKATDYCIQGSAAEVFKRAQVLVDKYLLSEELDIHILLPVHDELVFEVHRKYLSNLQSIKIEIEKQMTQFPEITVPLTVEWKLSPYTWAGAK